MLYLHDPITERIIDISDKSNPKYELYSYSRFNGQNFYAPISISLSELIDSITDPNLIPKIENINGTNYSEYLELKQVISDSENSNNKTKFDIVLRLKDRNVYDTNYDTNKTILNNNIFNKDNIFNKTSTIRICTISLLTKEEKESMQKEYYKVHTISAKDIKTMVREDIITKLGYKINNLVQ